ncbi:putative deacetylase LmbE-like domain-containing protein, partial [Cyathus striatus]
SSKILLLTAHPDDECMFFAPTILNLTPPTKQVILSDAVEPHPAGLTSSAELFSLCLSNGDADGLGVIRKAELSRSLDVLGIEPGNRWITDHPCLKDNFTSVWDPEIIANVVRPYVLENRITTILTFDYQGISSHPNHRSLPAGMKHLIRTYPITSLSPVPRVFALITVPVWTKYSSVLAPLFAKFDIYIQHVVNHTILPTFVSGTQEYLRALQAMREHRSQLVWFRWLYVFFSRYMWVNEWTEVKV